MKVRIRFRYNPHSRWWYGTINDEKVDMPDSQFKAMARKIIALKIDRTKVYTIKIGGTENTYEAPSMALIQDYFAVLMQQRKQK